ncbi:MAG: sulfate reduction electron transfer complex DsrMKJOP subunit DsrM [Deltaproteobacteria bacterium]|nr:sulfate reduction electron transfer complex DsrMKJOP subunit DsrM [Deltaproteobacteria bacterium]
MNINYLASLVAVIVLFLLAYVGVEAAGLRYFFGVLLPYLAVIIFIVGFVKKIVGWAKTPVPFRIPTTCGQQETLSWIKPAKIDNPTTRSGVFVRMLLEVLCFRSLFRNTTMELREENKLSYEWEKWLWLFALLFHYSFLTVLLRHLRFFLEPVPGCVKFLESIDGFLQIGLPGIMISGILLLAALLFLLVRRIIIPKMRYISLASDYFPLFLIIGIAITGILMRYFIRVDITGIKELTIGLVTFHPVIPEGIGGLFYVHLFFVSVLIAYFPFSKLMHLGGIFMSPTRNVTTDTRATRYVNPWNYDVEVHTYEEYEDEFREKMIGAGLPVEKES